LAHYYWDDRIKDDEMNRACSRHSADDAIKWSKETDYLGELRSWIH